MCMCRETHRMLFGRNILIEHVPNLRPNSLVSRKRRNEWPNDMPEIWRSSKISTLNYSRDFT